MTISRVGFVPSAPLLVPAVAGGSAGLDEDLRAACRTVVEELTAARPETLLVAAGWPSDGDWGDDHAWGFEGFGVPRSPDDPRLRLPWPLGIGAWLLDDAGWEGPRRYLAVAGSTPADLGVGGAAVLVIGDGTACRTEKAPGHLDDRAEGYDAQVAECLRRGDVSGLGSLDPDLGVELMCGGLTVWRWLAGVLDGRTVTNARLLLESAPYGVGYFAATWTLSPALPR